MQSSEIQYTLFVLVYYAWTSLKHLAELVWLIVEVGSFVRGWCPSRQWKPLKPTLKIRPMEWTTHGPVFVPYTFFFQNSTDYIIKTSFATLPTVHPYYIVICLHRGVNCYMYIGHWCLIQREEYNPYAIRLPRQLRKFCMLVVYFHERVLLWVLSFVNLEWCATVMLLAMSTSWIGKPVLLRKWV